MIKSSAERQPPATVAPIQQSDVVANDAVFRVSVTDLQPGSKGEVVLFNDSAFRDVIVEAVAGPLERGSVRSHVTAEGIDVSGFGFVRFGTDLIVYHSADTKVDIEFA